MTQDEELRALDAKIIIDDNALYRHTELASLGGTQAEDPLEAKAKEQGLSYVHLDGEIGCIVNGAGLAMATMDLVKRYGAEPANFLDVGGGASKERVSSALDIVCSEAKVKVVLVNIFGGITRCDVVADGLIEAVSGMKRNLPLVIRLSGTNEEEGRRKLCQTKAILATTMDEAARIAVREVER
jgi:succinyl-CoA synthetase beta subunit